MFLRLFCLAPVILIVFFIDKDHLSIINLL